MLRKNPTARRLVAAAFAALATAPAPLARAQLGAGFSEKPTEAEAEARWPAAAKKAGVGGEAVAICQAQADGRLHECKVVYEQPTGLGFGDAVLSLAPKYRAKTISRGCTAYFHSFPITWVWGEKFPKIEWRYKPTPPTVAKAYPQEARTRMISGGALLQCGVNDQARLSNCHVLFEEPPEMGFGAAALSLAPIFLLDVKRDAKTNMPAEVHIPINFIGTIGPLFNCRDR